MTELKNIFYLLIGILIVSISSCISSNIDAYYSTGNFDDGIALRLKRDNSFDYDRWSDCGLDRKGRGTYTINRNELELNFEFDSIEITINNDSLDDGVKLKLSLKPQHEYAYNCYKFIGKSSSNYQRCNSIKSNHPSLTIVDESRILRIYYGLEQSRFDSLDYNLSLIHI